MCGIFGTTKLSADEARLDTLRCLHHRGPDSNGEELIRTNDGSQLLFQHTRLAIQDLSPGGHQPMWSKDKRWCLTYNGELYNHTTLRASLSSEFVSNSDTETLVEYVSAFGVERCLNDINGIFAFALYDAREDTVYVVRDPFGIKPLYFYHKNKDFSFSSEIKPLLSFHGKQGLNEDSLSVFLKLRYVPSPETLLNNIHRLPPGYCGVLNLSDSSFSTYCYSKPNTEKFTGTIEDAVEQYNSAIDEAVKRQLIGDVPVGILLSGGIDSALVAQKAKDHPGLTGYTVGFGNKFEDCEIQDALETATTLGIRHQSIEVNPESLIDELPAIVNAVEEPLGTTSIMAMWGLTQLAKRDVTVALTGQGSDEPWGGYRRYKIEHLINSFPFLKSKLFKPFNALGDFFSNEALYRGVRCLGVDDTAERFKRAYALFSDDEIKNLTGKISSNDISSIQSWLNWLPKESQLSDVEKMMRIDSRMNLADDLLLYGDKISMAFALEARVPMLDLELVKFIESLPLHFRSTFNRTKVVHKMAAERYLPKHIVNRKKKGFQVPFGDWCRTVWREKVQDYLLDVNNPMYNVMSRKEMEHFLALHINGKKNYSKQLFALLTLFLWANKYL